uniref:Uncharacterized protein n=1 Tax=Romanomermis culicivorax TaxID=13658 RepID=A0A915JY78_ROMCU
MLCVEYLATKKPANDQVQGENVELSQQPLIGDNADANVQRFESNISRTNQYTVLPPTFKPSMPNE